MHRVKIKINEKVLCKNVVFLFYMQKEKWIKKYIYSMFIVALKYIINN